MVNFVRTIVSMTILLDGDPLSLRARSALRRLAVAQIKVFMTIPMYRYYGSCELSVPMQHYSRCVGGGVLKPYYLYRHFPGSLCTCGALCELSFVGPTGLEQLRFESSD